MAKIFKSISIQNSLVYILLSFVISKTASIELILLFIIIVQNLYHNKICNYQNEQNMTLCLAKQLTFEYVLYFCYTKYKNIINSCMFILLSKLMVYSYQR